jgi:hypothetical protein
LVHRRLSIPQYAIEAAAREIRRLLDRATQRRTNPWQRRFSFSLPRMTQLSQPNDIYNHIAGANQQEKEMNLAEMVAAAYNSPGIIDARQQASITPGSSRFIYRNGTIHGANARMIAGDLHTQRLFH